MAKAVLTATGLAETLAEEMQSEYGLEEFSKKDAKNVIQAIKDIALNEISRKGSGKFRIAGLVQIERKRTKAVSAKRGIPKPFGEPGETYDRKAKPAGWAIKARPLAEAKEMAG